MSDAATAPPPRLSRKRRTAAERLFRSVRPELEERFRALAGRDGKPAGLRWVEVQFSGEPTFVTAPDGRLDALLPVVVQFEPIPGGGVEEVNAARLPRSAVALFHHRPAPWWASWSAGMWGTGGRVLFNHTPETAAERVAAGH
ncbi:hypothetical protein [Alienimonas californiensis]|uniref:Uncharacterized protein n=1 Tax=Alienimonas californiensis TaxID=2527989 RepID=A0A517P9N8_9PLAN|nr:hypothetical protein [Alienimonas californiensis]QDT16084.1 hypothetical protein CA12_21820 [Alienimonas californiensis]